MRLQQLTQCTWWWIWTASLMMLNTGCWQTHYTFAHWHTTTVLMAVLQGNLGWLVPLSFFVHLLRKRTSEKSLRVQLPMYADNVAMSTFAQCYCSNRLISPACRVYSRKSAAAGLLLWAHAVTDRQMDRSRIDRHHTVSQTLLCILCKVVPISGTGFYSTTWLFSSSVTGLLKPVLRCPVYCTSSNSSYLAYYSPTIH